MQQSHFFKTAWRMLLPLLVVLLVSPPLYAEVAPAAKAKALALSSASDEIDGIEVKRSTEIINLPVDDYDNIYVYTGKATVTYIDQTNFRVYAQDMFGALCVDFVYYESVPCEVGDVITGAIGFMTKELGVPYFVSYMPNVTVESHGASKEPLEITPADLLADPEIYIHRLVRVNDVEFTPEEGQTFGTTAVKGTSAAGDVTVLPFKGTTLTGTPVPAQASVIGISRSVAICSVSPRSADDLLGGESNAPQLDVVPEMLFTGTAAPINADTRLMRYTVNAVNVPNPVSIYLTGANAAMYSLSTEVIPAGTSTTEVIVTYHPTAIGKHTGRINFDTTPETLATGYMFTNLAYDPDNMPSITLNPSTLPAFTASVGEKQEQEVKVLGANFPDNGSIAVMGEGEGSFIINTTMLSKYGEMVLRVTFQPKKAGTFTERIRFAGAMADTVYMTVTGSTTGELPPPPEKEGDELPLVTDNPLTLMNQNFDSVERNKPLSVEGWKNVAMEGTRAWWGFSWDDGNKAAKITAYDSKVESGQGTPAQMMLVTPPLDFVNAESKYVTFRIMGDNLLEDMTDKLEVCYIDVVDGDMYVEPIQGLEIPVTSDYNNKWVDFVMDLSSQQLSDVFFIGFRFTSTRGCDNSAIYYVDDVTWGRTDVVIEQPAPVADFTAQQCAVTRYYNGFDTQADFDEWIFDGTDEWNGWHRSNYMKGVPEFSTINPNSTNSLAIDFSGKNKDEKITSPDFLIGEGDMCSFYTAFAGIWLYSGCYKLYVNLPDGTSDVLFDPFLWAQETGHETARWMKFSFDLSAYVGKTVSFTFRYTGRSGEDMMVDDFEIITMSTGDDASVTVDEGASVDFVDRSLNAVAWNWSFPGGVPASSTEQYPIVTYPDAGKYDVELTVTNAAGETSTMTREGFVTVKAQAPVAAIGIPEGAYLSPYASMHIPVGVPVTFTDLSAGKVTDRKWTITGADIQTSGDKEVTVSFKEPGIYDVDLEVANVAGKSAAYVTGINVGGSQHIWNIEVEENADLAPITLGWYGYYGGSNFIGMTSFGEIFSRPLAKGTVESVDVFFYVGGVVTPDAPVTVSLTSVADNGLPGDVLASAVVKAGELVYDANGYLPTTFTFDNPVEVEDAFFVTVSGIPCESSETSWATDEIAMFCSPRREDGGKSTVYHELADMDDAGNLGNEREWFKSEDEFLSFAVAPKFAYNDNLSGVGAVSAGTEADFRVSVEGDVMKVESAVAIGEIRVHNMSGALVHVSRHDSESVALNVASLPTGVYLVTVANANTTSTVKVAVR